MRFSVPRSPSPSPTRSRRRSCTYRAPSQSSDSDSESSSDSDSFTPESESNVSPQPPKPKRPEQTSDELLYIQDAIASIRLRVHYHDPYEEWEKQTRKDAFRTAKHHHSSLRQEQHVQQDLKHAHYIQRLSAYNKTQMQEIENHLKALDSKKRAEEQRLKVKWLERDKRQWDRIESAIRVEEDKLRAKLEAERKLKEEEEARRLEQEKKLKEELQKRLQQEQEEQEQRQREQEAMDLQEMEKAEASSRDLMGFSTALDDWTRARDTLKRLKSGPLRLVKADMNFKSQWSRIRREIIPRIGQLTNDPKEITRVSEEIISLLRPPSCPNPVIYFACLSSLSKAILLQAEVEVTAEKRSAIPLALVAANLLQDLDGLSEIFWAKLVQRTGGWPIPIMPPHEPGIDYNKLNGFREDESVAEFTSRVAGLLRVYFHILVAPVNIPLDPMYRTTRYWAFFARMLGDRRLLEGGPVAPELLATALDVGGKHARMTFGRQWDKMMELLYGGLTAGLNGDMAERGIPVGGTTPEGNAARVRALLEVEKVMSS